MNDVSLPPVEKPPAVRLIVDSARVPVKKIASRYGLRAAVAMLLIGTGYFLAKPATKSLPDTRRYAFAPLRLPGNGHRIARTVHPDYNPNNGWISSVGAGASLADLENEGRPNGCILVDPRSDEVTYIKFVEDPGPKGTPIFHPSSIATLIPPDPRPASADRAPETKSPAATDAAKNWAPMGSVIGDFDGDGWMDVLVYYWGRLPVIFRNPRGAGGWLGTELKSTDVGGDAKWFTNCVCQADIDGDGKADLVIGNYFPAKASVLDPLGEKGTQEMQESMSRATNGGRKFVLLNKSTPGTFRFVNAPIELRDGTAVLSDDQTKEILNGWTLALAASDLDGDFLPELYIANDFGPDHLLHNESTPGHVILRVTRGRTAFDVPRSKTLGRDSFKGMGVDIGPLTPGGPATILVSNIAEPWALLESHFAFQASTEDQATLQEQMRKGIAPYRDRSEPLGLSRSGWGWDIKAVDFDNDGFPEVVQALGFLQGSVNKWAYLQEVATGNDYNLRHLWAWAFLQTHDPADPAHIKQPPSESPRPALNSKLSGDSHLAFFARPQGDGAFSEIGSALGFADTMVSRGIAVGDIDHDGRLDFVLANQWEDSFVYVNRAAGGGNYVGVKVVKPAGEKPAKPGVYSLVDFQKEGWTATPVIGARVMLKNEKTTWSAIVDGGNGHSGRRSAEVHFGVGPASPADLLDLAIQWRVNRPAAADSAGDGWSTFEKRVHAGKPGTAEGWWIAVVGGKIDAE